jgi:voltage-gated potassium channel
MLVVELILATIVVLVIILIHLVGLATLTRLLRSHSRVMRKVRLLPFTLLLGASVGLIFIHTVEIWLYAAIYLGSGAFSHFEEALYFSTVTYASIGYGDMLLTQLKLLGHDWLRREESGSSSMES